MNNSRNEVQSHVLAALYEKDAQGDTFDKIQAWFYIHYFLTPVFPHLKFDETLLFEKLIIKNDDNILVPNS